MSGHVIPKRIYFMIFGSLLLLTALSQRFKRLGPRVAIIGVAVVLLTYSIYLIAMLPQA